MVCPWLLEFSFARADGQHRRTRRNGPRAGGRRRTRIAGAGAGGAQTLAARAEQAEAGTGAWIYRRRRDHAECPMHRTCEGLLMVELGAQMLGGSRAPWCQWAHQHQRAASCMLAHSTASHLVIGGTGLGDDCDGGLQSRQEREH